MCGIAGFVGRGGEAREAVLGAMLARLVHRGPDDEGRWFEADVALGQRRLAVIDLSPAGRQPMVSACGRWAMTLNGEIYNFAEMRRAIEATGPVAWRGRSDSEVLLEGVARFGIDEALAQARGMFALALWDRRERRLTLARDRFGEKPLYWTGNRDAFAFASEMDALAAWPGVERTLCREAAALYFRFGYVPAPHAIWKAARKLEPGARLDWRAGEEPRAAPYWRLSDVVEAGARDRLDSEDEAVETLDSLLRSAVAEQSVADVPLGVFLSGGVDSATVTTVMRQATTRPVRTFTVGFADPAFDEAPRAAAIAAALGTEHAEHRACEAEALAVAPELGGLYDEPFADPSQIPTVLLARAARRHVTVCLSGDGGDELFAGYVRYEGAPRLWRAIRHAPLRGCAAALAEATPGGWIDFGLKALGPAADRYAARGRLGTSVRRAAPWLRARSFEDLYERTMTIWDAPGAILACALPATEPWRPTAPAFADPLEAMQWRDAVDYLPGDILAKVDRAAMAASLETRAPLLDPRIAAFAFRLPARMKFEGRRGKALLRRVLARYLPTELIDGPKLGFTPPLHAWLAGPLRDWAESLVGAGALARQTTIEPRAAVRLWRAFLAGDEALDRKLWSVLMFRAFEEAHG